MHWWCKTNKRRVLKRGESNSFEAFSKLPWIVIHSHSPQSWCQHAISTCICRMLVNGLVSARWRREVERAKGRKVVVMKVTRPKIFASSESACSVCRDLFHGCFAEGSVEDKIDACYQAIMKVDVPQVRPSGSVDEDGWRWNEVEKLFWRVCHLGTLGDFVAGQARHVARTTPTRHCGLARCGGSARWICVSFLSQTNYIKKYMYIVDCLNTLIWFCIISQVYVDLVEDRSCANSYLVSLKALAGNIQCFQCQELVYYFHKTEPKGDGAILIFLPGDILRRGPSMFVRSYVVGFVRGQVGVTSPRPTSVYTSQASRCSCRSESGMKRTKMKHEWSKCLSNCFLN